MPRHPVRFEFVGMPHLPAAEAAARRRMRGMEAQHPAVVEWTVCIEAAEVAREDSPRFHASAQARIVGGEILCGSSGANDVLAALRVAFNNLEAELDAEHQQARNRAAQWLSRVKGRLGQRQEFGR